MNVRRENVEQKSSKYAVDLIIVWRILMDVIVADVVAMEWMRVRRECVLHKVNQSVEDVLRDISWSEMFVLLCFNLFGLSFVLFLFFTYFFVLFL